MPVTVRRKCSAPIPGPSATDEAIVGYAFAIQLAARWVHGDGFGQGQATRRRDIAMVTIWSGTAVGIRPSAG
jgi:hypothetical protein